MVIKESHPLLPSAAFCLKSLLCALASLREIFLRSRHFLTLLQSGLFLDLTQGFAKPRGESHDK